jgi:hypothetical protein
MNKIDKERRRSMNAAPTRPSNKRQWQGAVARSVLELKADQLKMYYSYIFKYRNL